MIRHIYHIVTNRHQLSATERGYGLAQKNNQQPHQNQQTNNEEITLLGTKIGKCDICKTTKKILLLSYGFNLCQDCVDICTLILEQLEQNETKQTLPTPKITLTGTQTT
jgi:hypothetical protein